MKIYLNGYLVMLLYDDCRLEFQKQIFETFDLKTFGFLDF